MLRGRWKPSPPRPSSTWKLLSAVAVLLTVWSVLLAAFGRFGFTIILVLLTLPTGFVAGYFFRADLQRRGLAPPLSFLRVEGDDEERP
jgi:hypothetical protein